MTIKEIEQTTGLPRASVRFYESEGLISPTRGENGYRNYSQSDLDSLLKIKLLRRLDIPLEDIQALQKEQRSLDSVLASALTRLEQEAANLEQTRSLCRTLRQDGTSYAALDPRPYLQRLDTPAPAPVNSAPSPAPVYDRLPEAHCPFRRYFARNLDFFLYNVLFILFCQLALGLNVASGHPVLKFCTGFLAPLGLTLLLEPVMLHFFCTTPGKFLFGLKITRGDGSPLGLGEAFARTGGVLVRGVGLNIPVITTITQGYSLYQICKGRPLGWDYDLDRVAYWDGTRPGRSYWDSGKSYLKVILAGVLAAMCVLGVSSGHASAMAPQHQGDMTPAQFAENFNDTRRFRQQADGYLSSLLTQDGSFEDVPTPNNVIIVDSFADAPPLKFDFRTDDTGILKAVSFSYHVQDIDMVPLPLDHAAVAVWSLLYGFPGIDRDELARVHDEIVKLDDQPSPEGKLTYHHDFGPATADFSMTSDNYWSSGLGFLLAGESGSAACQMEFSISLSD